MQENLFASERSVWPACTKLAEGAWVLHGKAERWQREILDHVREITDQSPFRNMRTPSGHKMSVAMTNCGDAGWITDQEGYRYDRTDPLTAKPWPTMPQFFRDIAKAAAEETEYGHFDPDACLINRYEPGARLSLHQDRNERDFTRPIVSISMGLPATFQFGGMRRSDPVKKFELNHGDVVIWGGKSRLNYHGVLTLKSGIHPIAGEQRINLTFRAAY